MKRHLLVSLAEAEEYQCCVPGLRYGGKLGERDFKLLEVEESLLEELLQSRLVIKGDVDDEAVLCTSCKTYAIKFVSTSNTLLLCNEPSNRYDVAATVDGHLELVEIAPRLDKLKELVSRNAYNEDNAQEQLEDGVATRHYSGAAQGSFELSRSGRSGRCLEDCGPELHMDAARSHGLTAIQHDWD